MNFFPILPFLWQISSFLHNFTCNIEKFSALRAIYKLFYRIPSKKFKNFWRYGPYAIRHEDFIWCWREKTGKKLAYFRFGRGNNWNFLPKYLSLFYRHNFNNLLDIRDGFRTFSAHPILLMISSLKGRDGARGKFKGV